VVARLHIGLAWLWSAVACVGCSALLGLDAPQLAACLEGTCADAQPTIDATADVPGGDDGGTSTVEADLPDAPEVADVFVEHVTTDAPAEASPHDGAADDGNGMQPPNTFRCGGGGVGFPPPLYCRYTAEICCQTGDDAGRVEFACVGSRSACAGYPIGCANENDCALKTICCHYPSGMKCEPPSGPAATCPMGAQSGTQACDPVDSNECPQGSSCTVQLVNSGMPSPYMGCN
jgi:hypothetical protein